MMPVQGVMEEILGLQGDVLNTLFVSMNLGPVQASVNI